MSDGQTNTPGETAQPGPGGESPRYMLRLSGGIEYGPADIDLIEQWAREGRVPQDAVLDPVSKAGDARTLSVLSVPQIARVLKAPPTLYAGPPASRPDETKNDAVSLLIPYRNQPALIGYYVGVASLIPVVGFATGIVAVTLGIWGLIARARRPEIRGLAHAVVAIILGIGGPLFWVLIVAFLR